MHLKYQKDFNTTVILILLLLQIMIVNNTCFPGNDTSKCLAPRSSAGLTAGLTVFFLLLAISAGVIAYKCHSKLGQRRRQKKKDGRETPAAWSHEYVSVSREQSTPVYENLTTQTAKYKLRTVNQGRQVIFHFFSRQNLFYILKSV